MKLEINNKKKDEKIKWRLKNMFLNNQRVKEIKKEIKIYILNQTKMEALRMKVYEMLQKQF